MSENAAILLLIGSVLLLGLLNDTVGRHTPFPRVLKMLYGGNAKKNRPALNWLTNPF
jgi:hypothetical protein